MGESKKSVEEQERKILAKGEVSLILDSYEDIFSVFDPRPYEQRALSVDFLDEGRRATRELKEDKFQLRLLVPSSKRKVDKEKIIKGRLKEHFKKHAGLLEKDHKKIISQGLYFLIGGLIFMFSAAYILFYYHSVMNLFKEFLIVLLEPGGWFLFWEGLDLIIFKAKVLAPDLEFYRKMTKAEVSFSHY